MGYATATLLAKKLEKFDHKFHASRKTLWIIFRNISY